MASEDEGSPEWVMPEEASAVPRLPQWDPMVEIVRQQLTADVRRIPAARRRKPRLRLWWITERYSLESRAGMALLVALTAGFFVSACVVIVLSWPLTETTEPLSDVVAAAATATAFSSLVFTAFVVPHQAATEIAPGYSAELATRKSPWLVSAAQVTLTVLLFTLAALGPDKPAAVAAGLLTAALFGFAWIVSMQLASSGDLLSVAQRQAAYLRSSCAKAIDAQRKAVAVWFPRSERTAIFTGPVDLGSEIRMLAGFLRHMRSGVSAGLADGRPSVTAAFWSSQLGAFTDYAHRTEGRVGGDSLALQVLLDTMAEMVTSALTRGGEMDSTVQQCLREAEELAVLPYSDVAFAPVRGRLTQQYVEVVSTAWLDDHSTLPAAAVGSIGRIAARIIPAGGYEDASTCLMQLEVIDEKARQDGRIHIRMAVAGALLDVVQATVRPGVAASQAAGLLQRWGKVASSVLADWPAHYMLADPHALFVPGIGLSGVGLQQRLWQVEISMDVAEPLVDVLLEVGSGCIEQLRGREEQAVPKWNEPLASLYGLALRLVALDMRTEARQRLASKMSARLATWFEGDVGREAMFDGDAAESYWSATTAVAFLSQQPGALPKALSWLAVGPFGDQHSRVSVDLLVASRILDGQNRSEVLSAARAIEPVWGFSDGFMHLPANGIAPAMNRNQVVAPPELIRRIDEWVLATYPQLSAD